MTDDGPDTDGPPATPFLYISTVLTVVALLVLLVLTN
jgi:hypothetical protein